MPRSPVIVTDEFPYHIVARSNNREWFYVQNSEAWSIFRTQLSEVSQRYNARVIAFVLMSNHFHMILKTPDRNISALMNHLMRETSREISKKTNRINHVFGARYKWCVIDNDSYLAHAYRYVYRNPVQAGMAQTVESYSYSTLYYLTRGLDLGFTLFDEEATISSDLPQDLTSRLAWLNSPMDEMQYDLIRRALRRNRFQFSKNRNDYSAIRALFSSL